MNRSFWNQKSVVVSRVNLSIVFLSALSLSAIAQDGNEPPRLGAVELYESDSFDLNRTAGTMKFDGFRIFGDNWSLMADAAIANADELDFVSGQWRFDGNISLELDTASLSAESAVFVFRDRQLILAELRGNPAAGTPVTFEDEGSPGSDTMEPREPVNGSAMTLRYDDAAGTFELLGSVSLTVGPYLTTGCDLVYYLGQEEFTTGSTQCPERFRTIIVPEESAEPAAE